MHSPFHSLSGYSPNRNDVLTKNSGKPQRRSRPGWGGNILILCLTKGTMYPGYWMMMNVGQPMLRTLRHSRGNQEPQGNDRRWLTQALVSPDLPFWAIILICLAGLLGLIMCLICCFLVSKEVLLSSYYQVVRALYILQIPVSCWGYVLQIFSPSLRVVCLFLF